MRRCKLFPSMSNPRSIDMRLLDDVFEMGAGHVLDFSDRTFREFFADELDVDIDDLAYSKEGTSKAKRLFRDLANVMFRRILPRVPQVRVDAVGLGLLPGRAESLGQQQAVPGRLG